MTYPRWALFVIVLCGALPALAAAQPTTPEPPAGVKCVQSLVYHKTDKGALELDVAIPASGDGPFPVVVIFHGTCLTKGRKPNVPLAYRLAENGYVGVAVDFRYKPQDAYPCAVDDARAAIRWLRTNAIQYKIDPNRIAALGYSGGGTLACLLGMTDDPAQPKGAPSSRVQAVVAYYPPTDLAQLHADCGTNKIGLAAWMIQSHLETWLGGTPKTAAARYREASPITHVRKTMAPILLLHGTADRVVPIDQSRVLAERANIEGGPVTLLQLSGARHGFDESNDANAALARQMVQVFLDQHLRAK